MWIFQPLGAKAIIDLLACAIAERKLLFHSSDLANIPPVTEAVVALMYPLKWSHTYIPVLPKYPGQYYTQLVVGWYQC